MLSRDDLVEFAHTQTDFLNMRYFDGVLKYTVECYQREVKRWYAKVKRHSVSPTAISVAPATIILNPILCYATVPELEEIISHELIHVVQILKNMKLGHGKPFRDLAVMFSIPAESSKSCVSNNIRSMYAMKKGLIINPWKNGTVILP